MGLLQIGSFTRKPLPPLKGQGKACGFLLILNFMWNPAWKLNCYLCLQEYLLAPMEGYLMVVPRKAAKKVRNLSVKSGTSCIGHGCNIDGSKSTQKAGPKELISWSRITFVQILNSFLIVIMAPITIQQTHLRLETCIPIIYYPLDAFPMWLAQVFVEASCSIQLPEPASRISPRPRSVDFRWSWEAPWAPWRIPMGNGRFIHICFFDYL